MPANIFICCGGSGLQTAMRVNELLSEDEYWRNRLDEEIYYIVADTDMPMLEAFESTVRAQAGGSKPPHVYPIALSQDYDILQPLVEKYIEGEKNPEARQRLLEHWWSLDSANGQQTPFVAPGVSPLYQGAAQSPPASFFLAWLALGNRVQAALKKLLIDVRRFLRADADKLKKPLQQANLLVVSGLAGGTGRGCWELIAFKLRDLLINEGIQPRPYAMLYDASVFKHAEERSPEGIRMRVNALTGVSQISGWLNNIHNNGTYMKYALPHLENARNTKMDVIRLVNDVDAHRRAPVSYATLIFGEGVRTVLATSQQYQEMVGTALYGWITESSIQRQLINARTPYGSIAAATYEVPASTIRLYLERKLRVKAARWIGEGKNDNAVAEALKDYLEVTGLDFQLTSDTLSELRPSADGDLLQRVCAALAEEMSSTSEGMEVALTRGSVTEALDFAGNLRLVKPGEKVDKAPKELSDAITRVLKSPPSKLRKGAKSVVLDPVERAQESAVALLESTGSASVALQFLERLQARLVQELFELPSPDEVSLSEQYNPLSMIERFKRREYFFFGRRFNTTEIAEINGAVPMAIAYWNYPVIHREISKLAEGWMARLEEVRLQFSSAATAGKLLAERFEKQLIQMFEEQRQIKITGLDEIHAMMFSDRARPDKHIPEAADMRNFYRRELHPVLSREEVDEILPAAEISDKAKTMQIEAATRKREKRENELDISRTLRDGLDSEITDNNALPFDLISRHFSLMKVLEEMRPAWIELLRKKRGDMNAYNALCEKFHGFFGVRPQLDQDQPDLPTIPLLIESMCASLALGCQAYWQLRKAPDLQEVTVFPPSSMRQNQAALNASIQEKAGSHVRIYLPQLQVNASGSVGNDFVLMAHSYEGTADIGQIASLDYWTGSPRVTEWMERCEDHHGASIYSTADDNKGIGFPDPAFVRDPELAALRWRPWFKEAEAKATEAAAAEKKLEAQKDAETRALDAALYALLDPATSLKSALAKVGKGWKTPLIEEREGERFTFTRPAYGWEDGAPYNNNTCGWQAGTPVATSVRNVLAVLRGEARKGVTSEKGNNWRARILEEAQIFWNEVASEAEFIQGSKASKAMLRAYVESLGTRMTEAAEEEDRATWGKLATRLEEVLKAARV